MDAKRTLCPRTNDYSLPSRDCSKTPCLDKGANGAVLQFQINGQRVPLEIVLLREVNGVPGVIKLVDLYERPDSFILASHRDTFGQKRPLTIPFIDNLK